MTRMTADKLAAILFDTERPISDFKIMPGTDTHVTADEVANEIWLSMTRMGLIENERLVERSAL